MASQGLFPFGPLPHISKIQIWAPRCLVNAWPGFISGSRAVPKCFKSINFQCAYVDVHEGPWDLDSTWRSPLHHACDHSSYSWRISVAALQLAECSTIGVINTYNIGWATYYTPLLYVCDGVDRGAYRCGIVAKLIECIADVEARGQRGNTPFLLAVGVGFTTMLRVLLDRQCK